MNGGLESAKDEEKMIEIPMRLYTADYKKYLAPFRKLSQLDLQRRSLLRELLSSSSLLRGADWRAQLDRAWEDCKSRNS